MDVSGRRLVVFRSRSKTTAAGAVGFMHSLA